MDECSDTWVEQCDAARDIREAGDEAPRLPDRRKVLNHTRSAMRPGDAFEIRRSDTIPAIMAFGGRSTVDST